MLIKLSLRLCTASLHGETICQSGRIGRDAKTIGASYVVSVRASNEEGATEDIAGSNPASDTKTKYKKTIPEVNSYFAMKYGLK